MTRVAKLGILRVSLLVGLMTPVILIGAAACGSDRSSNSTDAAGSSAQLEETVLPVIGEAPEFELTHQDGDRMDLAQLRGRVVLMNFIYTSCPDVCQLQNNDLKLVRNRLDEASRRELVLVSVSFDHEVDTPPVLKKYAQRLGVDIPEWYFLTGSQQEISTVTEEYGVFYELVPAETHTHSDGETEIHSRAFSHLNQAILIDRDGIIRRQYLGIQIGDQVFSTDDMVKDISTLLASQE